MAETLESIIASTGLSQTYLQWHPAKPPSLPYIVWLVDSRDNFAADNVVYHPVRNVNIELYSKKKDISSESLVESALTANGIYFDAMEAYISSEKMHQVVYAISWDGQLFDDPPEPEPEEPEEPDPEDEEVNE